MRFVSSFTTTRAGNWDQQVSCFRFVLCTNYVVHVMSHFYVFFPRQKNVVDTLFTNWNFEHTSMMTNRLYPPHKLFSLHSWNGSGRNNQLLIMQVRKCSERKTPSTFFNDEKDDESESLNSSAVTSRSVGSLALELRISVMSIEAFVWA